MGGCTCGLLPCICVGDVDDAVDFSADVESGYSANPESATTTTAKLRKLFAADATAQCMSCMMLPCICPGDDDVMLVRDDETTSVEATSPLASDQDQVANDEETDEYGRVRLSSTSTDNQEKQANSDVWVAREIKPLLKPHQVEGVKFLYDHVVAGHGCILADYMGLGKTLQVITVIYSFLVDELDARKQRSTQSNPRESSTSTTKHEHSEAQTDHVDEEPLATVLVLCPAICLPNWDSEFQKWLGSEARARCPVLTLDSSTTNGTTAGRLRLLQRWKRGGGVLLMGYEMFRGLLNPTTTPSSVTERDTSIRVCSRMASATMDITSASAQETAKVQRTAREFRRLLCTPGADLVVMDEGHRMKDPSSLLCQSVAQIRSSRRLVLTGYPVQNSLSEYWCMVNFAREGFLGTYDEFRAKYERPILEGNLKRSHELIERLQNVVLRRGKALLRSQLPPKMEWILYCKLSPVQHRLYCDFLNFYSESGSAGGATADLLTAYAALLQVMNHPDIIYSKLCPSQEDDAALVLEGGKGSMDVLPILDDSNGWAWESEERLQEKRDIAAAQRRKKHQKLTDTQKSCEWARHEIFGEGEEKKVTDATAVGVPRSLLPTSRKAYHTQVLENSGKMAILLRIIEESFACNDKVVVFSQSVPTLKVISDFLRASAFSPSRAADDAAAAKLNARKRSKEGSIAIKPKRRRIVSMCRSHRIGQAKTVHVYRLVSTGTMERMIYEQQMKKVDLSTSVVDSHEGAEQKENVAEESATADNTEKEVTNLVPFSGFLQPPSEVDNQKELSVDDSVIERDEVLASCVKKLGCWLVRHAALGLVTEKRVN
ncbi:hypothetical protein JM18_008352 [Phytophthora kernoviae]|uniref:Helicase ATP-binding domain-containing protein n=2 Tax=Phytophthora kernoviae TaxID=325452 RepID=A0A8T0LLL5_9STRA|nr:hypothetical protein G195_010828 [Phytophthora kernoviae 00238/432]KAG2506915.1 hypothetical protein JM16_008707 [Phytophthora kernoviae]KAG2508720.1 hypothetical protein JM18_008352 [Phytophthora kernoviae]